MKGNDKFSQCFLVMGVFLAAGFEFHHIFASVIHICGHWRQRSHIRGSLFQLHGGCNENYCFAAPPFIATDSRHKARLRGHYTNQKRAHEG